MAEFRFWIAVLVLYFLLQSGVGLPRLLSGRFWYEKWVSTPLICV